MVTYMRLCAQSTDNSLCSGRFGPHDIFHNAASAGCRHYLCRRIDNRAALKVRRMVSATASA